MSRGIPRGPGIWIEEEKTTVTDIVEMRDATPRRVGECSSRYTNINANAEADESGDSDVRTWEAL